MSLNTSDALRPSIAVPSTLRKSLSATPLVNLAIFVSDMPVSNTAAVPNPSEVLAVAPFSATHVDPFPTIKLLSVFAYPPNAVKSAS